MSQNLDTSPAVIAIDIGKNSFHIVGQNQRGAIVLRQKWSRGQVEARLANLPPCRIGMEACVGAHHHGSDLAQRVAQRRVDEGCVFRKFPDADFGNSRTAISVIPGQGFR